MPGAQVFKISFTAVAENLIGDEAEKQKKFEPKFLAPPLTPLTLPLTTNVLPKTFLFYNRSSSGVNTLGRQRWAWQVLSTVVY